MPALHNFIFSLKTSATPQTPIQGIPSIEITAQISYPAGISAIFTGIVSNIITGNEDNNSTWVLPASGTLRTGYGYIEKAVRASLTVVSKPKETEAFMLLTSFDNENKHLGQNLRIEEGVANMLICDLGIAGQEKGKMIITYRIIKSAWPTTYRDGLAIMNKK